MSDFLTLNGVHTFIGQFHILEGVEFAVPAGSITVLLGRNGAGKTTTLRTIMGNYLTVPFPPVPGRAPEGVPSMPGVSESELHPSARQHAAKVPRVVKRRFNDRPPEWDARRSRARAHGPTARTSEAQE